MYFSPTTEYRFFSFTARSVDVEKDRLRKERKERKEIENEKESGRNGGV